MDRCSYCNVCNYYKRFRTSQDLMHKGFIEIFCKGEDLYECEIRKYMEENEELPSDGLTPIGEKVKV